MSTDRYSAALYMRLSKDDEGTGESSSIMTQRKMLTAYAKANHYPIYGEYVDDGFSGTNFDRPAFKSSQRTYPDWGGTTSSPASTPSSISRRSG